MTDDKEMDESFNVFFASVGKELSKKISPPVIMNTQITKKKCKNLKPLV